MHKSIRDRGAAKWLRICGWFFLVNGVAHLSLMLFVSVGPFVPAPGTGKFDGPYGRYIPPEWVFEPRLAYQYLMAAIIIVGMCIIGVVLLVGVRILKGVASADLAGMAIIPPANKPAGYDYPSRVGSLPIWCNARGQAWADSDGLGLFFINESEARAWTEEKLQARR